MWPRSRAGRWLLWLLILIVLLIILSQLFGGFQKGTKVGGLGFIPGTPTPVANPAANAAAASVVNAAVVGAGPGAHQPGQIGRLAG